MNVDVRPLAQGDVVAAEQASDITFLEGDRLTRRVSDPEPRPRSAAATKQ
jgi:hypothetical protein